MLEAVPGWSMTVDRGPDWLFIRLHADEEDGCSEVCGLAESLWKLLEQQFAHRMVLEMDEVPSLRSSLVGELVRLHKRITTDGGLLRLSGLSDGNQEVLKHCRLEACFPQYLTRTDAVKGQRPNKPR
jgi:anti-anti-sigma regulatory factor